MRTIITHTGDFARAIDIEPIAAQDGSYPLRFSSQLNSAREPLTWQTNFSLILQRDGLLALQEALAATA